MLILAGVSINAIVGDNGIITNAQNANIKSGMAALEEFLQEKYVENYDNIDNNDNKVVQLQKIYPQYFYNPTANGYGTLRYIESGDNTFYLINRQGLPDNIKENLIGGFAGNGAYSDYAALKDVYGVTSNLDVYYCSNGLDSIIGIVQEDLDGIIERVIFKDKNSSELGKILSNYDANNDGSLTSTELRSITTLEVSSGTNLNGLEELSALKCLTLRNVSNIDISGVSNCIKLDTIRIWNSSCISYQPIGILGDRLYNLYFINTTNDVLSNFCAELSEYDLLNLQYFGCWGLTTYGDSELGNNDFSVTSRTFPMNCRSSRVTDISCFDELSKKTKESIKYLFLQTNQIESLNGIENFTNLIYLRVWGNSLSKLDCLERMENLEYINAAYNLFDDVAERPENTDELLEAKKNDALYSLVNCTSLKWLDVSHNENLIWIDYIKDLPIKYFYMNDSNSISKQNITSMKTKMLAFDELIYSSPYTLLLVNSSTSKVIDYSDETISVTDFKTLCDCEQLSTLKLKNTIVKKETSEILSSDENTIEKLMIKVFKNLTILNSLDISGLKIDLDGSGGSKINNLNFLALTDSSNSNNGLSKKLTYLNLKNTDIIALGDTTLTGYSGVTIDSDDNDLSISNINILNSLTALKTFLIDSQYFNLSKMYTIINGLGTDNADSYGRSSGLACYNWTSLKTLEGCTGLTYLQIYSDFNQYVNTTDTLDLTGTNLQTCKLTRSTRIKLKLPRTIKDLRFDMCSGATVSFAEPSKDENNADIYDTINFLGFSDMTSTTGWNGLISNVRDGKFNVSQLRIKGNYKGDTINSASAFFDSSGKCNWISRLDYYMANWTDWYDNYESSFTFLPILLKNTSSITKLYISNYGGNDLSILKDASTLDTLYVGNSYVTTFNDIVGLTNIKNLYIEGSRITDISSISSMIQLKKLSFYNEKINQGLNSLSSLINLEYLDLRYNDFNTENFVNLSTNTVKPEFLNIFINLHTTNELKELYLTNTGLKGIRNSLNVNPRWDKLDAS